MRIKTLAVITLIALLSTLSLSIVSSSSQSAIVVDSFTAPNGTALENHQLDTGQTWQHAPFAPSGVITIDGNWAHHGSVGLRTIYLANAQLPADSYVSARIRFRDSAHPYLLLRSKSPTETYLAVYYDFGLQAWKMIATVDYVGPQSVYELGTWPESIAIGTTRDVRFSAVGDELRFSTLVGGQYVERIYAESYYVLAGGMPGVGFYGSSGPAGTYIDDFAAGALSGSPTPSPTPSVSPTPYASPSPTPTPTPTPLPSPATYEHRLVWPEESATARQAQLDALGVQGWECSGSLFGQFICSRRRP